MMRPIITAICIAILSPSIFSQKVEDGWKGLLPLKSTIHDVEKALGKPLKIDGNNYYHYRTDEAYINVNYSTAPCVANQYNRGEYNVPPNTILDFRVGLHDMIPIDDVRFDRDHFYRDTYSHIANAVYYRQYYSTQKSRTLTGGFGANISVQLMKDKEYVTGFTYRPLYDDAERLRCKNYQQIKQ